MRSERLQFMLLLSVLLLAPSAVAYEIDLTVDTGSDSNLNRAPDGSRAYRDQWLGVRLGYATRFQYDPQLAFVYQGELSLRTWRDWRALDQTRTEVGGGLRYKPNIGREVITWSADVRFAHTGVRSDRRSGDEWVYSLGLVRPLSAWTTIAAAVEYARTDAAEAAFDATQRRASVSLSRSVGQAWAVDAALRWRSGDFTASTSLDATLFAVSEVSVLDDTFGLGWADYRLNAHGLTLDLGASYVLAGGSAISFAWSRSRMHGDGASSYGVTIIGLDWTGSF